MTSFEHGDVVLCQFPYSDRNVRYRRPTLVVSYRTIEVASPLVRVLMITSRENRRWPGDVDLGDGDLEEGLLDPSVVRTVKIANVEVLDGTRIGRVAEDVLADVMVEVRRILGFETARDTITP